LLFLCVGLPGRLAEWCDLAAAHLARRLSGPVISRSWPSPAEMFGYEGLSSTLEHIAVSFIETGAAHVVLGARQPDEKLYAALGETGARFVLALDDPRMAVADMLAAPVAEPRQIARAVANSCALVTRYAALPGALRINPAQCWTDARAALAAMADHFGIGLGGSDIEAILADLPAMDASAERRQWAADIPEALRKMIDGALAGYAQAFADAGLDRIVWTRELFYLVTDAGKSPTEPLDAAGGSRILIYGPYIHLPSGSWNAQIVLGFSPEAAGYAFTVDVYSDGVLAAATFQPDRAGVYTSDLSFSLNEARPQGVEVRVTVASNDAKGHVAFGQVVLRPLAVRHAADVGTAESDFLTVLEL